MRTTIAAFFINLGQKVISFLSFLGGLSNLAAQTLYLTFVTPFQRRRIFDQAKRTGFDSLLIVSLIGMFIGMIMALQTAVLMQRLEIGRAHV